MTDKVKCKICGKVGIANNDKGLIRHLRLAHNICVPNEYDRDDYFEAADPESIIQIRSISVKEWRKKKKRKSSKRRKEECKANNTFVKIIYTPMSNG